MSVSQDSSGCSKSWGGGIVKSQSVLAGLYAMMGAYNTWRKSSVLFKNHLYSRKVYLGEVRVIAMGEPPKILDAFV